MLQDYFWQVYPACSSRVHIPQFHLIVETREVFNSFFFFWKELHFYVNVNDLFSYSGTKYWIGSWDFSRAFHGNWLHVSRACTCNPRLVFPRFPRVTCFYICRRFWKYSKSASQKRCFSFKKRPNTITWQLILTIHKVKLGLLHKSYDFPTNVRYFYRALSTVVQTRSSWAVQRWKGKISLNISREILVMKLSEEESYGKSFYV